jgi:hypothetical protein
MTHFDDQHHEFEVEAAQKLEAFNMELSGIASGRIDRFGVGENTKAARLQAAERSKTNDSFYTAAAAQAYAQTVSFRVGGRDASMSLGDMRSVASGLRNHYGEKLRSGSATEKDREKMHAYDGLLRLIDDVAAGKASPEEIAKHIEKYGLGQEIADAAQNDPTITASYATPQAEETAQAGAYAEQTASERNEDLIGALFNKP